MEPQEIRPSNALPRRARVTRPASPPRFKDLQGASLPVPGQGSLGDAPQALLALSRDRLKTARSAFVVMATTAELLALVWAAVRRSVEDLALAGVLGSA